MNLLILEIGKNLKRRSVLVVLALFLAANIYNIAANFSDADAEDPDAFKGYWDVYRQIEGKMTDETIRFVMRNHEELSALIASGVYETAPSDAFYTKYAFGDWGVFETHRKGMERIFLFNDSIEALKKSAEGNIDFYESVGNRFEAQKSRMIAESYGTRVLSHYYDMSGMKKYLNYDFSSLLIIILLVFIACPVFAHERESGMDKLLLSSVKGRHRTAFAKKHAVAAMTLAVCMIFYLSDLLGFLAVSHLNGWSAPIYQIKQFDFSPLTLAVWQFALLSFLLKCLGGLIISQVILFFSSLFKKSLAAFIASMAILLSCVWLYGETAMDMVNPIAFLCSRDFLATIAYANVFGLPVNRFLIVIISGIVLLAAVYSLVHLTYVKRVFVPIPMSAWRLGRKGRLNLLLHRSPKKRRRSFSSFQEPINADCPNPPLGQNSKEEGRE
jgi:hypothetical protein